MSRSVNKVILVGNLGRDAETKFLPSGVSVTNFSIATERRWKDEKSGEWRSESDWHNVTLWRGEKVAEFLTKGKQVYVEGRLQTRSYEDKDGHKKYATDVVCSEVILLGGRDSGGSERSEEPVSRPRQQAAPASRQPEGKWDASDDDIPF